jgi:hypothetical protein
MSRETFTAAVKSGKINAATISKLTKGGTLGGSLGSAATYGGQIKVPGFSGGALTAKQVKAMPLSPLAKKAKQQVAAPLVTSQLKPVSAAAPQAAAAAPGIDWGGVGAGAAAIGDVALDLSPVGMGMGLISDISSFAGMSLNALGIGGKKKAGGKYGRRKRGANYWRNRYEAMYWKAKYENARYGHGRMK